MRRKISLLFGYTFPKNIQKTEKLFEEVFFWQRFTLLVVRVGTYVEYFRDTLTMEYLKNG